MTCIVGIAENGKVYIGGDSAGVAVSNLSLAVRADKKVFRNGPFVMGFTSSFRMGQLLHHAFSPPKRHPDTDIEKYMVVDFINAVRNCLKNGGYAEKSNEVEYGGTFLVGYEGRLFRIGSDYQVGESVDCYDAVGCGEDIALGSLYSSTGKKPIERLRLALEASERRSAGVRGPFHFVEG